MSNHLSGPSKCSLQLMAFFSVWVVTNVSATINLGPIWDEGQFWIPRTYNDHVSSGKDYAVDFYWINPQAGNVVRYAVRHADDGYDADAELGRGKNVRAAHAGIVQLLTYRFSPGDCDTVLAQPQVKVTSGDLRTSYIHLETPDPIRTNDSVRVFNKASGGSLNLRSSPTTSASILSAMADGTRMSVIGGPVSADGYIWWRLQGSVGSGWAAENASSARKTLINSFIHRGNEVAVVASLNLRANASTSANVLAVLSPGTIMNVIGGPSESDGFTWWQLQGLPELVGASTKYRQPPGKARRHLVGESRSVKSLVSYPIKDVRIDPI